jgi:hypothetical protein
MVLSIWFQDCYTVKPSLVTTSIKLVNPALVTTSIKQPLVLSDLNLNFPSQCISFYLKMYLVTTCLMSPYFNVP